MIGFSESKVRIWILALIVGTVAGLLLAVRLNLVAPTKAEYEDTGSAILDEQTLENNFVKVAKVVGPAVVSISTEHIEKVGPRQRLYFFGGDDPFDRYFDQFFNDFFGEIPGQEFRQRGLGSGFIIDEEGYILTNQHVVQDADKITVTLPDGRSFEAEIKGSDLRSDLAVIKINARDLPVLKLGDSDQIKIGQWAIAAGNPFGFAVGSAEPTVTAGIVSAVNRSLPQTYQRDYHDLIQTDAAINPGNSGGPLVNIKGEVVGINVAIFSPSGGNVGIGFAIPVNAAKNILSRLIAGKKILYGWLGISIQDLTEELAQYFEVSDREGALVVKVLEGSPAEDGGFKEGDVIKKFGATPVKDTRAVLREVARAQVGSSISVEVIREKSPRTLKVKIGERPENLDQIVQQASSEAWRGIEVSELTSELAQRFSIREKEGVVITHLEPQSPAAQAELMVGDLILAVNRLRIRNIQDYQSIIQKIKGDALIRAERGFFIIKPE